MSFQFEFVFVFEIETHQFTSFVRIRINSKKEFEFERSTLILVTSPYLTPLVFKPSFRDPKKEVLDVCSQNDGGVSQLSSMILCVSE